MRDLIERQLVQDWSRLFGYAFSLTRDRERASDVLQQAALQALASPKPPAHETSIRAWLFKIVRNISIDAFRRGLVQADYVASTLETNETWNFDDRLISDVSVRQGLELLDPAQREVIELVDLQGFRYAEAAEILGIPIGTVMSRLSRARLTLLDIVGGTVRSLDTARRRQS